MILIFSCLVLTNIKYIGEHPELAETGQTRDAGSMLA